MGRLNIGEATPFARPRPPAGGKGGRVTAMRRAGARARIVPCGEDRLAVARAGRGRAGRDRGDGLAHGRAIERHVPPLFKGADGARTDQRRAP